MGAVPKQKESHSQESDSNLLEETRELLRKIEAVANIGHWEVDLISGKTIWSDQFFRILGFDPKSTEASTDLGLSIIHPDDREKATQSYQKSFETGAPYKIEKRIIRPDGEIRYVVSEGVVDLNGEGKPVRLFGVFKDITEEKLKEEKLNRSNLEIENILNTTQDLVLIFDTKGNYRKVSKSAKTLLGYEPEEMAKKSFYEFVYPADLKITEDFGRRILAGESTGEFRNRYWHADGRLIDLSWSCFFDTNTQTVFATARDITQLLRTKKSLSVDRQKLSILLNSSPDSIWTLDSDYNLITANQKFLDAMKEIGNWEPKPGDNLVQNTPLPTEFVAEWKALYDRALNGEAFSITRKVTLLKKGGYMEIKFTPIIEEGKVNSIACYSRDISQLMETKEELRLDRQKLAIILDSSPDTIWTVDTNRRLIEGNKQFLNELEKIAGWKVHPGDNLLSTAHFPEEYIAYWKMLYDRAFSGETFSYIQKHTLNNTTEYLEINLKPIFDQGEIIAVACYAKDITQRKEEEIRMEELVKRLNLAQKIGKLGYWEFDIETEVIYWSDEVYQIWEIDKSRFRPNFDLFFNTIHPEDQEEFLAHHNRALNGVAPLDAVHRILLPSGEVKFVHELGGLETDPESGVTRFRGTVQDITQEKNIEKELLERNAFIESALENIPMGIAVNKNRTREATYINPAFGEIYGWPPEVLKDVETFFSKIYPNKEYREFITSQIMEDIQSGDPQRMIWKNIPIVTQTGEERIVSAKNIPLPEQDLMISTVIDETDRYWAEHSLRTSNERFHLATQAVSDAIWDWDIQKNSIFWGKGYHRLFGYPEDMEYVTEDLWQTKIHPDDLKKIWDSIQIARKNKETHRWSGQYRFKKFDGTYAYVEENTVIIRDSKGKPIRMVGALQDITLEKEKELQLQKKTLLIDATARIVESFLETGNWQEIMDSTLKLMGESVGTDRAYLIQTFKNDEGQLFGKQTHEWTNGRVSAELHNPDYQKIPLDEHPEFLNEVKKRKPFFALTKDAEGPTRQILEEQNIRSILTMPIFVRDEFQAFLGFDDCTDERLWSEDELSFIQAISTNLAFAIERKKYLDKIQEAFESRNALLESIGDSFYAIDKNYRVTYWNNIVEKLTGVKKEDILGKSIWDFIGTVNDQFRIAYEKAFTENEAQNFETFDPWVNAWLEVTIYPANGGLSAIIKDISDRKNTAKQLAESNERFEIISEATNDAIWDWNLETGQHFWGEGFQKLFGINFEEEGKSPDYWEKRVHPEDYERVISTLTKLLSSTESSYFESDYRFQRQDGSYAYVNDKGSVIRNKEGKPIRLVGAMQDITHRKEYEESLKKLNEELANSNRELEITNKELEQFAYVASHDLQEPLRMISSFLGLIEKRYHQILDEKGLQYIHFAVDGAKRMREIILDLLEFSRIGNISEPKKPTNLNDLLQEVLSLNKKSIEEKNAIIHLATLPTVVCHSNSIIQLFQNLISNGLKYQPEGQIPEIWIEGEELSSEWEFKVRDNGIGIDEEFKDKIFIIFQRLHQKEHYSGSGIGLAICKKIVEFHGGKIWVESTPGKGSEFHFTLKK